MSELLVDTNNLTLRFKQNIINCVIGRSGPCPADQKREGDGHTPLGCWPVRCVLFRRGRSAPPQQLKLPWRWIGTQDGWSDDPLDPCYNQPVRLPHPFSAETLIRNDVLYDIVVVLGHNDTPPIASMGSAVFFHIADEGKATEGCIAIGRSEMDALLPMLKPGDLMVIV